MNNLINRYQNGEQEVFGEILKKYNNLLYKVINKYPTLLFCSNTNLDFKNLINLFSFLIFILLKNQEATNSPK